MEVLPEVVRAEARLRGRVRETPLEPSPELGGIAGCNVYLKLENFQHTGSFKVRGALNKLGSLSPEERKKGVVAASSGNHGAAVAFGLGALGAEGTVFVPEGASPSKVAAIRRLGAEVRFHGTDAAVAEAHAREFAESNGQVYLSPYNDLQVIGGQGTIAVEILRQLGRVDEVFVPVGGGGLVSGIAGYLKAAGSGTRVTGCQPENSAVMAESVRRGYIVDTESGPTLSDGTAGGVEPGALTFDLCRKLVDGYVLVPEAGIRAALRLFMGTHHMMIEGAAGVAVAAFLGNAERLRGKTVVLVICGSNIDLETLRDVLR